MNVEYSAVSAKLKAMYSKFLKKSDYEALLQMKSVSQICAYLKNTQSYAQCLSGVNEKDIHRGQIEVLVEKSIQQEYIRLYNFCDSSKRETLKFWFMYREIEFLIEEIKHVFLKEPHERLQAGKDRFDAFFETHTRINKELLYEAKTLGDCVAACKDTPYYTVLKRVDDINSDLFSVCMALEIYFYSLFWNTIKRKLDKTQSELFKQLIGTKIDIKNLMWIYRGKKYFDFDDDMIFTYLLPGRYRLSENQIKEMVKSESVEQFIEEVKNTKYASLFDGVEEGIFPEENYNRLVRSFDRRMFSKHSASMLAPYVYLDLKEIEMKNIVTIIEGVRYGEDPAKITLHLDI